MIPHQLHILQSIQETGKLGTMHRGKSYIVAFTNANDAIMTARKIGMISSVQLGKYKPARTVVTEQDNNGYIEVIFDEAYPFTIRKENTPTWEWIIETCGTMELFRMPMANTGLIITKGQIGEDEDFLTFEGYMVDPMNDPHLFRVTLMDMIL